MDYSYSIFVSHTTTDEQVLFPSCLFNSSCKAFTVWTDQISFSQIKCTKIALVLVTRAVGYTRCERMLMFFSYNHAPSRCMLIYTDITVVKI